MVYFGYENSNHYSSFTLLSFLGLPSYTIDFDKGITAYNNGYYATALKEWKSLAEQGDVDAQYNLDLIHWKGLGVPQDDKEAVWFDN